MSWDPTNDKSIDTRALDRLPDKSAEKRKVNVRQNHSISLPAKTTIHLPYTAIDNCTPFEIVQWEKLHETFPVENQIEYERLEQTLQYPTGIDVSNNLNVYHT